MKTITKTELIKAYKTISKKDLQVLEEWEQASNEIY